MTPLSPSLSRLLLAPACLSLCLISVAGCGGGGSPPDDEPSTGGNADAAGGRLSDSRSSIGCDSVIANVPVDDVVPGWGAIPAELQLLPTGATLCGTGIANGWPTALVTSDAFEDTLVAVYRPGSTAMGCELTSEVVGNDRVERAAVTITCEDGRLVSVNTDTGYDFYSISLISDGK